LPSLTKRRDFLDSPAKIGNPKLEIKKECGSTIGYRRKRKFSRHSHFLIAKTPITSKKGRYPETLPMAEYGVK